MSQSTRDELREERERTYRAQCECDEARWTAAILADALVSGEMPVVVVQAIGRARKWARERGR